ncbi:MAG: glucokinase [Acidobacteria bacterium]|uniref:Glucokinase n=1 Tax=Candidatus Polarisedimenticola svalbardensis TaxID=2886004 RepID=A0A8J7CK98_9BACT|nr:glucokinase [Candidatus Polarisedimenticola svalbardensis]
MPSMILAGDVGGTKTILALFRGKPGKPVPVRQYVFDSRQRSSLESMVRDFLAGGTEKINVSVFGVAGPVSAGRSQVVNLNWPVDRKRLSKIPGVGRVEVINDLEATARGVDLLPSSKSRSLTPGIRRRKGPYALIAPGTGLGTAGMLPEGGKYLAFAGEGGHRDFAATDETGYRLHRFLVKKYGRHVSAERVCSGNGFRVLLEFVVSAGIAQAGPSLLHKLDHATDPNAVIAEAGNKRSDPAARAALSLYVSCLGAVAGDLALTLGATGGVWIAGGIAPRILPSLTGKDFLESFRSKGRMRPYMEKIPVRVILDPNTALYGAAAFGAAHGGTR